MAALASATSRFRRASRPGSSYADRAGEVAGHLLVEAAPAPRARRARVAGPAPGDRRQLRQPSPGRLVRRDERVDVHGRPLRYVSGPDRRDRHARGGAAAFETGGVPSRALAKALDVPRRAASSSPCSWPSAACSPSIDDDDGRRPRPGGQLRSPCSSIPRSAEARCGPHGRQGGRSACASSPSRAARCGPATPRSARALQVVDLLLVPVGVVAVLSRSRARSTSASATASPAPSCCAAAPASMTPAPSPSRRCPATRPTSRDPRRHRRDAPRSTRSSAVPHRVTSSTRTPGSTSPSALAEPLSTAMGHGVPAGCTPSCSAPAWPPPTSSATVVRGGRDLPRPRRHHARCARRRWRRCCPGWRPSRQPVGRPPPGPGVARRARRRP